MKPNLPPPPDAYCNSHKRLGPGLHKLGLSCGHFAELSLKAMDRPLTRREKWRYRCHFLVCAICRNFEKQMLSLHALVNASFSSKEPAQPDPAFLDAVRARLNQEAKDQNH